MSKRMHDVCVNDDKGDYDTSTDKAGWSARPEMTMPFSAGQYAMYCSYTWSNLKGYFEAEI
jgi:hypothetical protein